MKIVNGLPNAVSTLRHAVRELAFDASATELTRIERMADVVL
jgi:hypothetical protein